MTEQQAADKKQSSMSVQAMVSKIVELQEKLVEAQEKSIMLSTQLREMEMMARDGEDLKSELANQSALLSDKSRENKRLHQDLARLTSVLEEKMARLEELEASNNDLQHQLKQRESERDLLAVMLTEKEKEQTGRTSGSYPASDKDKAKGWLDRLKGKA